MRDQVSKNLKGLLRKYNAGAATEDEKKFIEAFYQAFDERDDYVTNEEDPAYTSLKAQIKKNIDDRTSGQANRRDASDKIRQLSIRYAAVAAVVLAALIFTYFFTREKHHDKQQLLANKIVPGSNRALLKLANGNIIDLTSVHDGLIAQAANVKVTKTASGQLVYSILGASMGEQTNGKVGQNTISTPNGGQYNIILPDGTKVMLNAASSLTYPVAFIGNERLVQLKGEAYFEVAHNKHMPFKVQSDNQTVTVLGTHFNINAYADESVVKTTLLEGLVSVTASAKQEMLAPGQQTVVSANGEQIKKVTADVEKEVAWKNGVFSFDGDNLGTVMRQVSRWYDVKVQFNKDLIDNKFYGEISRASSLNDVIKILELSNVKIKVDGRTIIVTEAK